MREHQLKTLPEFFAQIASGVKTFEIRRDDRGFAIGDVLVLQEFDPAKPIGAQFSGKTVRKLVPYLTRYAQQPGYVVMALADPA